MQRSKISSISLFICFTLMIALMSALWASPVEAKSSRVAKIEEIKGQVYIKKAGGSKEFRAYRNMTLNSGDHISTRAKSSLKLKIIDRKDEVTIEEKSDLYISELQDALNGGKKTKFSMWGGSIWVKASSLVNSADEFEIETPTAIMGVRGTNLLVGVNPKTGESTFFIASGEGKVKKSGDKKQTNIVTVYPSQQIVLDKEMEDDLNDYVNIVDLDNLTKNTGDAIIEAIIENKQSIDKENKEYIKKLEDQQTNQEEIDRINRNLDNLVGNIVNSAVEKNKVDKDQIAQLISEVNQNLDNKLDLNNIKPQELSDAEKAKQAQIKLLEEQRKKKLEEEKKKQEELKKQNEALLKKLQEQKEKQEQEKLKAQEAGKKKAEEELVKKLANDVAALSAFKAKLKVIEEERKKQDDRVNSKKLPVVEANPVEDEEDPEPTISIISSLSHTVDVGASYILPTQVSANMSDGSTQQVNISWNPSTVETSTAGTYFFQGTVSGYNQEVTLTLFVILPEVEGISITPMNDSIGVKWSVPTANAYSIDIYVDGSNIDFKYDSNDSIDSIDSISSYIIPELDPDTLYTIEVELTGYDSTGEVEVSTNYSLEMIRTTNEASLAIEMLGIVYDSIKVGWSEVAEAQTYKIYVNDYSEPKYTLTAEALYYVLSGLNDYTDYTIRIEAWDADSLIAGSTIAASTPHVEDSLGLSAGNISDNSAVLIWNNYNYYYEDNAYYKIYLEKDSVTSNVYEYSGYLPETINFNLTNLDPDSTYQVIVEEYYNDADYNLYNLIASDIVTFTSLPTPVLVSGVVSNPQLVPTMNVIQDSEFWIEFDQAIPDLTQDHINLYTNYEMSGSHMTLESYENGLRYKVLVHEFEFDHVFDYSLEFVNIVGYEVPNITFIVEKELY